MIEGRSLDDLARDPRDPRDEASASELARRARRVLEAVLVAAGGPT